MFKRWLIEKQSNANTKSSIVSNWIFDSNSRSFMLLIYASRIDYSFESYTDLKMSFLKNLKWKIDFWKMRCSRCYWLDCKTSKIAVVSDCWFWLCDEFFAMRYFFRYDMCFVMRYFFAVRYLFREDVLCDMWLRSEISFAFL